MPQAPGPALYCPRPLPVHRKAGVVVDLALAGEKAHVQGAPGVLHFELERLLVVNTVMDHYPERTTKEYFREQVPEEKVREILGFLPLP